MAKASIQNVIDPYLFLSIKDQLDAREAFHLHLMNKADVVGTAIGKYRRRTGNTSDAKTLGNTRITPGSWPCILVFVDEWVSYQDFKKRDNFDDYIPSAVYLPDGRRVPLCVIKASNAPASNVMVDAGDLLFPSDNIGGGYPLLIESQGIERIASIGCVVSDGNKYYAITNRHAVGTPGTVIYTRVKGTLVPIGKSADRSLGNIPFGKLYNGWAASAMVTNVDVGLIEIDNLTYWKADIYGLGTLGKLFDLNTSNFSLNLIGRDVKAYGSVSGELQGGISAFFYRYKSVGGLDYVADMLIGPRDGGGPLNTLHGDSGTVWVLDDPGADEKKSLQPVAIQWGQHCFVEDGSEKNYQYALATCLSNVLRELEVDLVSGWNTGSDYTWGEVGHYTIANFATGLVANAALKKLMNANLDLISFQEEDLISDPAVKKARKALNYTPLADVPDLIWKIIGGDFQRRKENPNHFADMDKPDSNKKTLLKLCQGTGKDMKFLTPAEWLTYYTDKNVRDPSKGILPFRAWQIFLQMVDYASKGNAAGYIAAAGVLAHYVGDACQPLHISYMFNGIPGTGTTKKGKGVHEAFESKLVNKYNGQIITAVKKTVKGA